MTKLVKALVVDDHPLVANATKALLEDIEGIEVIGIAGSASQCMKEVSSNRPDLIFLDYRLPDQSGIEVAAQIKSSYPDIRIVIFTGIDITDIINKSIELKLSGVLSKESSTRTIKNMVNCILDNHSMLPFSLYHQAHVDTSALTESFVLDQEEIHIMNLLLKGATLEQVAEHIHMSKRTVDNYLRKIYEKMGVQTRAEALEKFLKSMYQQS
ncbi:response regulator transcription factor [Paenibacillus athensensis]|uniref:Two-component system response regulator n=1 Tax=Paenibacillus athensensis TaxID=1967502 RepID=A0A4Y8PZS1_9BACL|nr:response regulator transcription factor [Paenibacillus athensensis]MCD1261372.1 response regulator transcription factor [Paenibacillus athensensis]